MDNENFINISQRAYKFIRGYTMNFVYEGLIELITNCDDAYDKGNIKSKVIDIICDYNNQEIIVRDQAIGLSGDDMKKCFLQVGEYTSSKESRGFFSRGSKDVSALGEVTFDSIKDDMYSRVSLSSNAEGKINFLNKKVSNVERENLKISKNGLQVSIKLIPSKKIDDPTFMINRFTRHYSLRKILSDQNTVINLDIRNNKDNHFNNKYKLNYSFPKGDVVLYLTYTLPSYPDAEILFVLNKSKKELHTDIYNNDHFNDYGVLFCSGKAIHTISCLDHQNKHYSDMKRLYGVISTSYINKLMYDFDSDGPTLINPSPIIDPSRVNGLNIKHPFYEELIKIPNDRIRLFLEEGSLFEKEHTFYIDEINDLVQELDVIGSDFIESNEITTIGRSKANKLVRGIESDRGKYVNVEKNFSYPLYKMEHDDSLQETDNQPYKDHMTRLFDIIGRGDEGKILTDKLADEKLFKVSESETTEKKQIFVYDKVEETDTKNESLNSMATQKNNIFSIKFIEFSDDKTKYQITKEGFQIVLKININFPTIKKYFTKNEINNDKKIESVLTLSNIISESLAKIQISSYIDKDYIKADNNDSHSNYETIFQNFDNYKNIIEKKLNICISKSIQKIYSTKEK